MTSLWPNSKGQMTELQNCDVEKARFFWRYQSHKEVKKVTTRAHAKRRAKSCLTLVTLMALMGSWSLQTPDKMTTIIIMPCLQKDDKAFLPILQTSSMPILS